MNTALLKITKSDTELKEQGVQAITKYEPPHDIHAEQCVIASMLIKPDCIDEIGMLLSASDFYREGHALLFLALNDLNLGFSESVGVDLTTIRAELTRSGQLEQIGGMGYITSLLSSLPSASNVKHYAEIVLIHAQCRRLMDASIIAAGLAKSGLESMSMDALNDLQSKIESLITNASESTSVRHGASEKPRGQIESFTDIAKEVSAYAVERRKHPGELSGLSTGWGYLDSMTGGLELQDMTVLAAPPSCGKTAIGTEMLVKIAKRQVHTGLISLEMPNRMIAMRAICAALDIDSLLLRAGTLSDDSLQQIEDFVFDFGRLQISAISDYKPTLSGVKASIRRLAKRGCKFVMLDYIGLIQADGALSNASDTAKAEGIAVALKAAARESNIHLLALAQMTKSSYAQESVRPRLGSVRYSGEAQADNVWYMYRPEMFQMDESKKTPSNLPQPVELLIVKGRNGQVGTMHMGYIPTFTKFFPGDYR